MSLQRLPLDDRGRRTPHGPFFAVLVAVLAVIQRGKGNETGRGLRRAAGDILGRKDDNSLLDQIKCDTITLSCRVQRRSLYAWWATG